MQLARLKAGISQHELAVRAGVPRSMISAYEHGRRQPTLPTLMRLLRAAGFDLRMHLEPYVWADDPGSGGGGGTDDGSPGYEEQWRRWHGVASTGGAV